MITTDMSANIVGSLLKRKWSVRRIARTIRAPEEFVHGVISKKRVLTLTDIKAIAEATGGTAPLMILNSITDINPSNLPLVEVTRRSLRDSADFAAAIRPKTRKRRRTGSRAA